MLRELGSHFFDHSRLYVLVLIFLLLTIVSGVILPLGRGYDEFAHFQYIRFIAEHHRPPISEVEQGQGGYKARHHPPFYHGLAGLLFSWVDSEETAFKRIRYGEVPSQALIYEVLDVHWFLHTAIMNFPYQNAVLLWHLSRLFSSVLAVGTIIVTYFTVLMLYPRQRTIALLAAASLAFIPRFVFTSSVASDDNMLALLMAIYLFLMVCLIKGNHRPRLFILLGIVLGLAITTKFSVALVPLMMCLFFCYLAWRQGWPFIALVKRVGGVALTALLVSSWWFIFVIWNSDQIKTLGPIAGIFNTLVPNVANNVSGADFLAILQGQATVQREPLEIINWLANFGRTFWAVPFITRTSGFPWEPFVFWVIWLVIGLLVGVGLVKAWRRGNEFQRTSLALFLLHILLFLPLMVVRYYLNGIIFETSQGRHVLMPAALAIGAVLAIGWANWTHLRTLKWTRPILPTLLLFWSLAHLHVIYNVYPKPLPLSINPVSRPQVDTLMNLMLFDSFEFVGYSVKSLPEQSVLETTLVWEAHRPSSADYLTEVRLLDQQGEVVSNWLGHPADGYYPTRVWADGEVIYDRVKLPLLNLDPGTYTLEVYLLPAYQRPLIEATAPLVSVPITIENSPIPPSGLRELAVETADQTIKAGYQLWPFDFLSFSRPEYHYRATIPILWEAGDTLPSERRLQLKLVGPNGQEFEPLAAQGNLKVFIVGADWPAGTCRLKVELVEDGDVIGEDSSAPLLQVRKGQRQFTPPTIARQVEANFFNFIKLLGYDLPTSRVKPGEGLPVFVYWQDLQIVNSNLIMFNQLYDTNNQLRATFDHILPPYFGGPILWVPGEIVTDGYTVPIEADVPDGIYYLRVGLFLPMGDESWIALPVVTDGQATGATYATLGPIKIGGPPADVLAKDPLPQYPRSDILNDSIKLIGYDLNFVSEVQAVKLTLYWQSLAEIEKDYTTFVHLQDEDGQIVAQKDGPPAGGAYPTSLWDATEIIRDEILLPVPADPSISRYKLLVGIYDSSTGERLTVPGSEQNAIVLTPFEIGDAAQ